MLNPGAESPAHYPWSILSGDLLRSAHSSNGGYGWNVIPQASSRAKLVQLVPFDGVASTTYHERVALRCPSTNATACDITLVLTAVTSSGTGPSRAVSVTIPRDGAWRVQTFDPASFGLDHQAVRMKFTSKREFGVDAVSLTSAFGGP